MSDRMQLTRWDKSRRLDGLISRTRVYGGRGCTSDWWKSRRTVNLRNSMEKTQNCSKEGSSKNVTQPIPQLKCHYTNAHTWKTSTRSCSAIRPLWPNCCHTDMVRSAKKLKYFSWRLWAFTRDRQVSCPRYVTNGKGLPLRNSHKQAESLLVKIKDIWLSRSTSGHQI